VVPDGNSYERLPLQVVLKMLSEKHVWPGLSSRQTRLWYFDANFPYSKIMRATAWFGLPLPGFHSHLADVESQLEKYSKFINEELLPMLEEASTDNVQVFYKGPVLTEREVFLAVRHDAYYAIGSFLFVCIYMCFHLHSPILTILGMGIVILSFPIGLVFFRMTGNTEMPIINMARNAREAHMMYDLANIKPDLKHNFVFEHWKHNSTERYNRC
jgi:hypothetical protein